MRLPRERYVRPEDRVDDNRADRWLQEIAERDRGYVPKVWTPEYVGVRLVETYDVILRLPAVSGPRQPRTGWREITRTLEEIKEHVRFTQAEKPPERRERPTKFEIERADKVIDWPMRFLDCDAEVAACVTKWAIWKAADLDVDTMADQFFDGDRARFHVKRDRGLIIISAGLNLAREAVS
jgi:hypothetical protein